LFEPFKIVVKVERSAKDAWVSITDSALNLCLTSCVVYVYTLCLFERSRSL